MLHRINATLTDVHTAWVVRRSAPVGGLPPNRPCVLAGDVVVDRKRDYSLPMNVQIQYRLDKAIVDAADYPQLGGNINGPSLICVPGWVNNPLGRYYLYFAHHEGASIRLMVADDLDGPWQIYQPGALTLEHSLFCQYPPAAADTHPDILASIAAGIDGDYPHIASPDVHIDHDRRKILMYYHGRNADGTQQTRLAESDDGIEFVPLQPLLGDAYFRVFRYNGAHYAIAWGSVLYRSTDGGRSFERGPRVTDEAYRHGAILQTDQSAEVYVIWSRAGDSPESLLISRLSMAPDDTEKTADWTRWRLTETTLLHRPERSWEGAGLLCRPSCYGGIMEPVNEIRDPAIYCENDQIYLLYSVRGEQGIALLTLVLE